jgi:hypothetical protein
VVAKVLAKPAGRPGVVACAHLVDSTAEASQGERLDAQAASGAAVRSAPVDGIVGADCDRPRYPGELMRRMSA